METPVAARVLAGRYRMGALLGRGGMAEVYDGYDERLQRPVAVKVLRPEAAAEAGIRTRFEVEARAAAGLSHPNVVAVFDTGEDAGTPFIVMERLPGDTLADRMAGGPVDHDWLRRVAGDVLGALDAAHRAGIVHRDVKPGNILLGEDGCAKVADFGIAKSTEVGTVITGTGLLLGTPAYLAPERIEGHAATPQSDLYSLGVVLYEALAGAKPFDGDTPIAVADAVLHSPCPPLTQRRADVPPDLATAIAKAMARVPADRPSSARQMAALLGREPAAPTDADPTVGLAAATLDSGADPTLVGTPVASRPDPVPVREASPTRRRPANPAATRLMLAGAALLMIVLVVALARNQGSAAGGDAGLVADIRELAERVQVGDGPAGPLASERLEAIALQVEGGGGSAEANALLAEAGVWRAEGRLSATALDKMVEVLGGIDGVDQSVATSTTVAPTTTTTPPPDDDDDRKGRGKRNKEDD